jgi:cytochrome c-type biogenesis protein CcmH
MNERRRQRGGLVLLVWLGILTLPSVGVAEHIAAAEAAQGVYERLIAPCCWTQTLDVHESELVTQLRAEIVTRLSGGETGSEIEDDLAQRFGERIRAVPRGRDPRNTAAVWIMGGITAALALLCALGWCWTRARLRVARAQTADDPQGEYDAQLDRELARQET